MKVALIADVHANLPALEAVLANVRQRGIETVWHAGDFVGYGAFPEQVTAILREAAAHSILGNYDRKVLRFPEKKAKWRKKKAPAKFRAFQWAHDNLSRRSRRYLRSLPEEVRLDVAGWRVLITHGSPASPKEHLTAETPTARLTELAQAADADVIVCAHSHQPFCRQVAGVWFINPGSVGRPEGGDPRACYAVLEIAPGRLAAEHHRVEYDAQRAAAAIRRHGLPETFAQMVLQGKNLEGVLEAAARNQPDPPAPLGRSAQLAAAAALAERCHYEQEHTEQVTRLALRLFDELRPLHGLGPAERHWLHCAALLHDIGWMEGRQGHHKTALRVILTDASLPLEARQRRIVGSVARYHRRALPDEHHEHFAALDAADRELVCKLAGILRVADGLDRTHTDVVTDVACRITAKRVVVGCFVTGEAWAEIEAAGKKGDLFEQTFGRALAFEALPAGAAGCPRRSGQPPAAGKS